MLTRNSRFDPQFQRTRNYRTALFAFARTSTGNLRSRRYSRGWRAGARRTFAGIDRDRKSNRACRCRCLRRACAGYRIAPKPVKREIDRAAKIYYHTGENVSGSDQESRKNDEANTTKRVNASTIQQIEDST